MCFDEIFQVALNLFRFYQGTAPSSAIVEIDAKLDLNSDAAISAASLFGSSRVRAKMLSGGGSNQRLTRLTSSSVAKNFRGATSGMPLSTCDREC
jgi:hypothetical protein